MPKNQEKWVEELKGLEMIIEDGKLNGCLVYHEAIVDFISNLLSEERKKWVEEICNYILAKHEHCVIKEGRFGKVEIETDRPILDSLELEEFIKNLK
jgi:hypothetical protein